MKFHTVIIHWTVSLESFNGKVFYERENIAAFLTRPERERLTADGNREIEITVQVDLEYHPWENGDMYCPEEVDGWSCTVFSGYNKLMDAYLTQKLFDEIPAMIKHIKASS